MICFPSWLIALAARLGNKSLHPTDINLARFSAMDMGEGMATVPDFYHVIQVYYGEIRPEVMAAFARSQEVHQLLRGGQPMWDLVLPLLRIFVVRLWCDRSSLASVLNFFSVMLRSYDASLLIQVPLPTAETGAVWLAYPTDADLPLAARLGQPAGHVHARRVPPQGRQLFQGHRLLPEGRPSATRYRSLMHYSAPPALTSLARGG